MSTPAAYANPVSTVAAVHKQQIKIVKAANVDVDSTRDDLLRDLNYMRAQIGRLDKMARDMHARLLKTE